MFPLVSTRSLREGGWQELVRNRCEVYQKAQKGAIGKELYCSVVVLGGCHP